MLCGVSSMGHKIYLYFGLLVFSLYVLLDTNQILTNSMYRNDFVSASMGYYLDILNIFTKLTILNRS
jgi:FtsH-binding integral membrane protein